MPLLLALLLLLPLLLFPLLVRYLGMMETKISVSFTLTEESSNLKYFGGKHLCERNGSVYLWFLYIAGLCWLFLVTAVCGCSFAGWAGSWDALALAGLAQHGANKPFSIDGCRTQLKQVLLITWDRKHTNKHMNRSQSVWCDRDF